MSTEEIIRDREELSEQIRALKELQQMAASYGFDISVPARNAREAVQWLYFGYLAAVKEQNGAAMSLGRTSTFLDIYFERDLTAGTLTEEQAQEIIDDFVIKLRIVRFLRTPEYDELVRGRSHLGHRVDWRHGRRRPAAGNQNELSLSANALQPRPGAGTESDDLVFAASAGWISQFRRQSSDRHQFHPIRKRRNHAPHLGRRWRHRLLCFADAGGQADAVLRRPRQPRQVPALRHQWRPRRNHRQTGGPDHGRGRRRVSSTSTMCMDKFEKMMDWLAGVYVNAMNVIHYMHDKYAYERIEMALHDYAPLRTMAFGIAGMSVVADSLSAIRYAKVRVIRDETGLVTDYQTEGEFPQFGNNDNRVDHLASWLVSTFMNKLRKYPTYRNALHTQSVLTITSNVVYGKSTGNTPDGRRQGEPFAPGANPMHGRDQHGIHASAASVAKIPYRDAADGISLTTTLVPKALGRVAEDRVTNLRSMLDAFFGSTGLPHECECAESRNASGCDGPSRKVSAPDDSRLGLCGELRAADSRAADGCDQSHVPRRCKHE